MLPTPNEKKNEKNNSGIIERNYSKSSVAGTHYGMFINEIALIHKQIIIRVTSKGSHEFVTTPF